MSAVLPYAVVAGIDLNGLGVVRALGAAGIPVVAVDTRFDKPTASTRFAEKIGIAALSGSEFVDELLRLRKRFSVNPVLILTQEASVVSVSRERERLASHYRFTMASDSVMTDLLDKNRFQAIADSHGFPIPRAVRISRGEPSDGANNLRFPCVLKPACKSSAYEKRFVKAYKVSGPEEVVRLWAQIQETIDQIIVQEWIEGDDSDVYFCLQYRPEGGRAPTSFTGRKIAQWPTLIGGTATCVPAPEAASELTALTSRFFESAGFAGIGSMEYKRDRRDGRFYMVEPTVGRTDYQEEIAALNGVNIPLAAYFGELGIPPPVARSVRPARAWRDPLGYANARAAGSAGPMRKFAPNLVVCDAYFRARDPMPYFALKFHTASRKFTKLYGLAKRPTALFK